MRAVGFVFLACALTNAVFAEAEEKIVRLIPQEIRLEGVTVLPVEQTDAVLEKFVGKPLGFGELQRLRVALSQLYSDAGYVNSGVVVPDQDIGDVLVLQAIEGRLTRVEVVGDTRLRSNYLRRRVTQRNGGVLNVESLQSTLRWLQNDPNIDRLDAELLPGLEAGESVLRLSVDDPKRVSFGVYGDNYRAASLGAEAATVVFSAQNLTGYGERTQLSASVSDGSDAFSARVDISVDSRNSRLGLFFTRSDAQIVEEQFQELDIESEIEAYGVSLWRPLFDSNVQTLALTLGFEKKFSESTLLGIPFSFSPGAQDGESETASFEAGLEWALHKPRTALALRASYRRGFHIFGATEQSRDGGAAATLNPTGADGEFGRYRLQGSAIRQLITSPEKFGAGARLVVKANAQLAEDPLLSLEKLAVGGRYTVRGFRENSFVRDSGVALSVDLEWPLFSAAGEASLRNLAVVPFVDVGWSWDKKNVNPGAIDSTGKGRISSAGVGLLWQPFSGARAEIFWGEAIGDNRPADSLAGTDFDIQDDGLHFQIGYSYSL